MKATDLEHMLAKKYGAPEWIFLPQVRSSTGYGDVRTADGIAINTYPSRGFEVDGFEIKVSRSDWLVELKNAAKADEIFKYCNKFWIVAADKTIVWEGELPKGWGLMYARGNGLFTAVQPVMNSPNLDMGFVCGLLRRATVGMIQASTIAQQLADAYKSGQRSRDYEFEILQKDKQVALGIVTEFEQASGVKFGAWHDGAPEKIGNALRRVLAGEKFNIKWDIESAQKSLINAFREIKKLRKAMGQE